MSIVKALILLFFLSGCSSYYEYFRYVSEDFEMPSKVYKSEYNQAWKAVVEIMKKYDLSLQSIESGVIKSRWMENTREFNFVDAFNKGSTVRSAKFKLIVNVSKGFRSGGEITKVTIYRRQLVEQDFLQGWKELPSDGIHEKVLLYRIGRAIKIDNRLQKIEEEREKKKLEEF